MLISKNRHKVGKQSKLEYIFCIGWFEGWGYPAEGSADTVCP